MTTDSQGFKTVATFTEKTMADLCAARLGDNGIPAGALAAVSSHPSLSFARNIQVKVNESDYEAAMSILAAADKAE